MFSVLLPRQNIRREGHDERAAVFRRPFEFDHPALFEASVQMSVSDEGADGLREIGFMTDQGNAFYSGRKLLQKLYNNTGAGSGIQRSVELWPGELESFAK